MEIDRPLGGFALKRVFKGPSRLEIYAGGSGESAPVGPIGMMQRVLRHASMQQGGMRWASGQAFTHGSSSS